MRNIWAITRATMKEAVRKRSMAITFILSLLFICGVGAITQQGLKNVEDNTDPLITFQILGTIRTVSFFGALLTIFITMNSIPLELERRTVYTMLSKPIERYQFLLGKFFGSWLLIAINIFVMAIIGSLFILSHDTTVAVDLLRSFGILMIRLTALCALIILFTTFMPATGGAFLAFGLYVLGQGPGAFRQLAESEGPHPIIRGIAGILYPIVSVATPRVNKLNFDAPIMESPDQLQAALMVLGYSAACLVIATFIFGRKEL